MTDEQGLALARLMRDRPHVIVTLIPETYDFDLPGGYVVAAFDFHTPKCVEYGIAPDGGVSS